MKYHRQQYVNGVTSSRRKIAYCIVTYRTETLESIAKHLAEFTTSAPVQHLTASIDRGLCADRRNSVFPPEF